MLTFKENEGIKEILCMMPSNELLAVAKTMTTNLIQVESTAEAIKIVCMFASNPVQVLRRKKVKKEYLFKYLYNKGVSVNPSGDKETFLETLLTFWKSSTVLSDEAFIMENDQESNHQLAPLALPGFSLPSAMGEQSASPALTELSLSSGSSHLAKKDMGIHFSSWFYRLLNSLNDNFENPIHDEKFGEHHFWKECKLKLLLCDQQGNSIEKHCLGSEEVSQCLSHLVLHYKILFNPNLNEGGVKTFYECHGLVKIVVCGLVHRDKYIGFFEQTFGLIQDVSIAHNWKVNFSELKMHCNFNCLE